MIENPSKRLAVPSYLLSERGRGRGLGLLLRAYLLGSLVLLDQVGLQPGALLLQHLALAMPSRLQLPVHAEQPTPDDMTSVYGEYNGDDWEGCGERVRDLHNVVVEDLMQRFELNDLLQRRVVLTAQLLQLR
jgi:hypothetical protein